MRLNLKENCKTLFKSCIDTKVLIERRKNSFFVPLIIFLLIIFLMSFPSYLVSINRDGEDILESFPDIEKPLEKLLTTSIDCKIENATLNCKDGLKNDTIPPVEDTISYSIFLNYQNSALPTDVDPVRPKLSDNYVLLLSNLIKFRYIHRDYVNGTYKTYEIIGNYSNLEGYDFSEISEELINNPDRTYDEITNFADKVYKSTLKTSLLTSISSALVSFSLLVLVTAFMLKSLTLFKRKKGLKYKECLKISLTSALPALLASIPLSFIIGINFSIAVGFIYLARILYIYIRYFFSNRNNIYDYLYATTNEERFNLK